MNMKCNFDPNYALITRREAASLLAMSISEFDRRRKNDPHCPKGFKDGSSRNSSVRFRLIDIYTYCEKIMNESQQV
ncbi:putative DNA-binding transcriptional regulator AlpA [Marinobacterium sp. MBR-109]|jgi:predicted DNA-binding transcriptional regulator AlpA